MGLPLLAAVTPSCWEVTIRGGNSCTLAQLEENYDLVGISLLTVHAAQGYEIADHFRSRGIKVILGGVHCTGCPQEAQQHADAVVMGYAEQIWPSILTDFTRKQLKPLYRASSFRPFNEIPCRDLIFWEEYADICTLEVVRGCPSGCAFCVLEPFWGSQSYWKPISLLMNELDATLQLFEQPPLFTLPGNPLRDKAYMQDLSTRLQDRGISFTPSADLIYLNDSEYLKKLYQAGCRAIYVECEAISPQKSKERYRIYEAAIAKMQDNNIRPILNLTVGYDEDDQSIFEQTFHFLEKNQVSAFALQMLTPWPGTPLFVKLQQEGRLLHQDWSKYDNYWVVFRPKQMQVEELQQGLLDFYRYCASITGEFLKENHNGQSQRQRILDGRDRRRNPYRLCLLFQ